MSICAVVNIIDNIVINKIVAEPTEPSQDGTYLIPCDNVMCDIGWIWNGVEFIDPNPPAQVEEVI